MDDRFAGMALKRKRDTAEPAPTLGEIGLNQFAPYLMNRVIARWNANMAEDLKAMDLSTAKMRALAVLSITPSVTLPLPSNRP